VYGEKRFHFRSFWPRFPGFADVVAQAWHCPLDNVKSWSDQRVGNFKSQLKISMEVVHRLEVARDSR
jgi:hypothetical protein